MSLVIDDQELNLMTQEAQDKLESCETPEALVQMAQRLIDEANEKDWNTTPEHKAVATAMLNVAMNAVDERLPELARSLTELTISVCVQEGGPLYDEEAKARMLSIGIAEQLLDQRGHYTEARYVICKAHSNRAPEDVQQQARVFIDRLESFSYKEKIRLPDTTLNKMKKYGRGILLEEEINPNKLWVMAPVIF